MQDSFEKLYESLVNWNVATFRKSVTLKISYIVVKKQLI